MRICIAAFGSIAILAATAALAQQPAAQKSASVDPGRIEAAVKASWPQIPADWRSRMVQDETMKACSASHNSPPPAVASAIMAREKARIEYPPDGNLMGDWKKGEAIAQNGYGLRFTDYPAARETGGNCYACHQLDKRELSYGTVAPSLLGYRKTHGSDALAVKAAYERIYNSQAVLACSNMPRFGSSKVLTIEQIKDLVALLMAPDSPVNQ